MREKKLRISIVCLLTAVALASFGCGGGGSGTASAPAGGVIPAVAPDAVPASREGNSSGGPLEPPSIEGGGITPADSSQDPQVPLQLADSDNQIDGSDDQANQASSRRTTFRLTQNSPTSRQVDYSTIPQGRFPLPPGHGLEQGEHIIPNGYTRELGNIIIHCIHGKFGACHVNVDDNGQATYTTTYKGFDEVLEEAGINLAELVPGSDELPDLPLPQLVPTFESAETLLPKATEEAQAPVIDFANYLHVGAGVDPDAGALTAGVARNAVSVSSGEVTDGVSQNRLLRYMSYHVGSDEKSEYSGVVRAPGLETYPDAPTIRLAEGTSDLNARYAAHAVQLINSALPFGKRITISANSLPADTSQDDMAQGEILLHFDRLDFKADGILRLGTANLLSSITTDPNTNQNEVEQAKNAVVTINEEEMRLAHVFLPKSDPVENTAANWETILEEYWDLKALDKRVPNTDSILKLYNDKIFISVVVHEIMHALGFYHIDETSFPETIMHSVVNDGQVDVHSPYLPVDTPVFFIYLRLTPSGSLMQQARTGPIEGANICVVEGNTCQGNDYLDDVEPAPQSKQGRYLTPDARSVPGHILFPIDRAALLAAYGKFSPGDQPEEITADNLGDWSNSSFHLRGDMELPLGQASFGVSASNGFAQPWATGPKPWTDLEDNVALSGSASWSGALLGVTSASETVAGDAALNVDLESLTGQLNFTNMEKWAVGAAPGAAGNGATWGDGDLGYTITVRGNTFVQTGGDDGYVTGAFFGAAHEAMGGVLERSDLSAGFGGKR